MDEKIDNLTELLDTYLKCFRSKDLSTANTYDKFMGISSVLRAKITDNWIETQKKYLSENQKSVYYISLEYNFGSPIKLHTATAGLQKEFDTLKKYANISENEIYKKESNVEMGHTLEGDFAPNILEALASNGIPSIAYGLWYGFAQFKQSINTLEQVEMPYYWTYSPHPWAIENPDYKHSIYFGGHLVEEETGKGSGKANLIFDDVITATPFDYPLSGYKNGFVNTLRFWDAIPSSTFNGDYLYHNDYLRACDDKMRSVKFLRYLFNDEPFRQTSELHIKQQYFLASASIKDIIYRHTVLQKQPIETIAEKAQIFLVDCRCGLAIVEFIHILSYEYNISFEQACVIAKKIFVVSMSISDSLEFQKIPLYIFEKMLPFHIKVIFEMNELILEKAREMYGISDQEAAEISLIEEGAMKKIRMANLVLLFSKEVFTFSNNDVSKIKELVFPNTERLFNTDIKPSLSAVSLRRWLAFTNSNLVKLISSKIGDDWIADNKKLSEFEKFSNDISVQNEFEKIKNTAKIDFFKDMGINYSNRFLSETMFISHSRKITLANSQILLLFYIACRYIRISEGENLIPRIYLFSGRANPSDFYGKGLVALINIFAQALHDNPLLKVHFIYNRNATTDEKLLRANDLAEYISSPLTLESPVYNIFKCAANGTIVLTGKNKSEISVASELGKNTTFSFADSSDTNNYNVNSAFEKNPILKKAFDLILEWIKYYSGGENEEQNIHPFLYNLRLRDEMKMFSYFEEYCKIQDKIDSVYKNKTEWYSMALRNIARSSVGSIDETLLSLYSGTENK